MRTAFGAGVRRSSFGWLRRGVGIVVGPARVREGDQSSPEGGM